MSSVAPSHLQRALKQTKPFASDVVEAYLSLLHTADHLLRPAEALLGEHDLSHTQYNVLRILRGAGAAGLPCGEIAARLVTRDPDVARLLDRLEKRGFISRSRDLNDRRLVLARLSPAGMTFLDDSALHGQLHALHRQQLNHLGPTKLRTLIRLLDTIRAGARSKPVKPRSSP
jgi:DNA-binding MarR family transcriptional regulator